MADKLVSLVNTQRYVRYRDIWDLRWLKQQGAMVRINWIRNKVVHYFIDDYPQKLVTMLERLPDIIKGDTFRNDMARFIPHDVHARCIKRY